MLAEGLQVAIGQNLAQLDCVSQRHFPLASINQKKSPFKSVRFQSYRRREHARLVRFVIRLLLLYVDASGREGSSTR